MLAGLRQVIVLKTHDICCFNVEKAAVQTTVVSKIMSGRSREFLAVAR